MIPTNWYIITGPPCSGKTTMVERLQQRGYAVRFEITRTIIEDLLREGGPRLESVLQRKVLQAKVEIEEKTPPEYMQDAVRRETREEAFQKGQRILREYQRLGYDVIAVPVMSIEERVRFVLGKM